MMNCELGMCCHLNGRGNSDFCIYIFDVMYIYLASPKEIQQMKLSSSNPASTALQHCWQQPHLVFCQLMSHLQLGSYFTASHYNNMFSKQQSAIMAMTCTVNLYHGMFYTVRYCPHNKSSVSSATNNLTTTSKLCCCYICIQSCNITNHCHIKHTAIIR